ncbi:SET domain-containing protein 4 [Menidia menidia]
MGGSGHRSGRAARKRRQKQETGPNSVSLCHLPQFVSLMRFLHQRGFSSPGLQPALFRDTGRGLKTLQTIKPGDLIISLPESCLITTSTVLDSYLGQFIKSWRPRLSPLLVLCVFLVCERHRGGASPWFPYIDLLPPAYTCPAYFCHQVTAALPKGVRQRAEDQREAVRALHSSNREFFRSLQPVLDQPAEDVLTYEALRWAWCSVNTRSVFITRPPSNFLSGTDNYALAPFLDLLNHRPDVQVEAGFNSSSGRYEIRSVSGTRRHRQAFISYGCHDNQRLLLEYGFVARGNPHSVVYVEPELLRDAFRADKTLDQKMTFLRENGFLQNLTVSGEGPGWRLLSALRLLSLPGTLYPQWKLALLGVVVCEEAEGRSLMVAMAMCRRLLGGALRALDRVGGLRRGGDRPIGEQLAVVGALREEERCILGKCLEALGVPGEESETFLREPN